METRSRKHEGDLWANRSQINERPKLDYSPPRKYVREDFVCEQQFRRRPVKELDWSSECSANSSEYYLEESCRSQGSHKLAVEQSQEQEVGRTKRRNSFL